MKIYVDTREKPHAVRGILDYFDRHGIEWERVALKTGDYMLDGKPNVVIDRKQNLSELARNLLSADSARFYREVRRARADGIRLIILCEQSGVKTYADVKDWRPMFGRVSGRGLAAAIFKLEVAYHVPVLFCHKRSTGRRILEILNDPDGARNDG